MTRMKLKQKHRNERILPEGKRSCPICGETMMVETKGSFAVDTCSAHGVWLDKGELDKIVSQVKRRATQNKISSVRHARREGKMSGSMFGLWSLLLD